MIQITPQMRVLVAVEAADFRRGIDGLAQLCRVVLQVDPFAGAVFVFRNRRRTAIKLLVYDGQGFWLCHKRCSKERLRFWPARPGVGGDELAGGGGGVGGRGGGGWGACVPGGAVVVSPPWMSCSRTAAAGSPRAIWVRC